MNIRTILAALGLLAVCSCSSVPRVAPRFVAPSVAPIQSAHKEAEQHIEKAKAIASSLNLTPEDKAKGDALLHELSDVQSAIAKATGATDAVDQQGQQQAKQGNTLADNYDKQSVQIKSLEESRHRYVKMAWLFGGILGLEVLAVAGFLALKFGFLNI